MFVSATFVPSAPLLVPELAGPGAVDAVEVRTATVEAGRDLAERARRWIAIGGGDPGQATGVQVSAAGNFARFGVDVPVALQAPVAPGADAVGARQPLSMLIAGWLRGQTGATSVRPIVVDPDADASECARLGAQIAAIIDNDPEPIGLLVVGDGATSLTPKAPGGGRDPAAVTLQAHLDEILASADVDGVGALDIAACAHEGVGGRAAWQVAAAAIGARAVTAHLDFHGAPFGVGYVVARWIG